jgi:hypothetical protein
MSYSGFSDGRDTQEGSIAEAANHSVSGSVSVQTLDCPACV